MPSKSIGRILEENIGLSVQNIGQQKLEKAIQRRIAALGLGSRHNYLQCLQSSTTELEYLIEEAVVPETWFFRLRRSFDLLFSYAAAYWQKKPDAEKISALSVPCSTGEEPYSIAMTLHSAGLSASRCSVHALDISKKALNKAQKGIYSPNSFRGSVEEEKINTYFKAQNGKYKLEEGIKQMVYFSRGNLLQKDTLPAGPFQIIFCRNLMIYLSPKAQQEAIGNLKKLLSPDGLVFIGHAERTIFEAQGLKMVADPGTFVCTWADQEPKARAILPSINKHKAKQAAGPKGQKPAAPEFKAQSRYQRSSNQAQAQKPGPVEDQTNQDKADYVDSLLAQAWQLADQGNLGEALNECQIALEYAPAEIRIHFLMGLIHQALNDIENAQTYFQKVLYLDPKHAEALDYLILIAREKGQPEKAQKLRKRRARILGEQ